MNTFGLGRRVHTFQLGKPSGIIGKTWKKVVEFTVNIARQVNLNIMR